MNPNRAALDQLHRRHTSTSRGLPQRRRARAADSTPVLPNPAPRPAPAPAPPLQPTSASSPAPCPCNETTAAPAPAPPAAPDPSVGQLPPAIALTDESRDNVMRAPDGTRFFCLAGLDGETHCAAGGGKALSAPERSQIKGETIDPLTHGPGGTGHQKLARLIGVGYNQNTARVGYVDGAGYGLSLEKVDDCNRSYAFRSAFNAAVTPNGSREMTPAQRRAFETNLESAFPPCPTPNPGDDST